MNSSEDDDRFEDGAAAAEAADTEAADTEAADTEAADAEGGNKFEFKCEFIFKLELGRG